MVEAVRVDRQRVRERLEKDGVLVRPHAVEQQRERAPGRVAALEDRAALGCLFLDQEAGIVGTWLGRETRVEERHVDTVLGHGATRRATWAFPLAMGRKAEVQRVALERLMGPEGRSHG